jgi:hypothetical protein
MKHAQFVRMFGLFSVLGVAAAVVGCGSESQQPAGENTRQVNREFFKAKTSQNKTNAAPSGRSTKGQ